METKRKLLGSFIFIIAAILMFSIICVNNTEALQMNVAQDRVQADNKIL